MQIYSYYFYSILLLLRLFRWPGNIFYFGLTSLLYQKQHKVFSTLAIFFFILFVAWLTSFNIIYLWLGPVQSTVPIFTSYGFRLLILAYLAVLIFWCLRHKYFLGEIKNFSYAYRLVVVSIFSVGLLIVWYNDNIACLRILKSFIFLTVFFSATLLVGYKFYKASKPTSLYSRVVLCTLRWYWRLFALDCFIWSCLFSSLILYTPNIWANFDLFYVYLNIYLLVINLSYFLRSNTALFDIGVLIIFLLRLPFTSFAYIGFDFIYSRAILGFGSTMLNIRLPLYKPVPNIDLTISRLRVHADISLTPKLFRGLTTGSLTVDGLSKLLIWRDKFDALCWIELGGKNVSPNLITLRIMRAIYSGGIITAVNEHHYSFSNPKNKEPAFITALVKVFGPETLEATKSQKHHELLSESLILNIVNCKSNFSILSSVTLPVKTAGSDFDGIAIPANLAHELEWNLIRGRIAAAKDLVNEGVYSRKIAFVDCKSVSSSKPRNFIHSVISDSRKKNEILYILAKNLEFRSGVLKVMGSDKWIERHVLMLIQDDRPLDFGGVPIIGKIIASDNSNFVIKLQDDIIEATSGLCDDRYNQLRPKLGSSELVQHGILRYNRIQIAKTLT